MADAWHALLPEIVERAGSAYFRRFLALPVERVTFVDALSVYGDGVWFAFVLANLHSSGETRLVHLPLTNEFDANVTASAVGASTTALARVVTRTRNWQLRDGVANADFRRNLKLLFHPEDREDFSFSAPIDSTTSGFHITAAPAWSEARNDVLRYVGNVVTDRTDTALIAYGTRLSATLLRTPNSAVSSEPHLGHLAYDAQGEQLRLAWLSGPHPS